MDAERAQSLLEHAERVAPDLRGPDGGRLIADLDARSADLGAAVDWFVEHGRGEEARRLGGALVPYAMATTRLGDGIDWLERALAVPGGDDVRRARAAYDVGYLRFWTGDHAAAAVRFDEALAASRAASDPTVQALALAGLARVALTTDVEQARRLCREALAVTDGTGERLGRGSALHVLGVAAQMAGDLAEAREVMQERIASARAEGAEFVVAAEAANLSTVERQLGHLDEAQELALESFRLFRRRDDGVALPWTVNVLAAVALAHGQHTRAARLVGVADTTMTASGGAWPPDELVHYEATTAALVAALGADEFARLRADGAAMPVDGAIAFAGDVQRSA